MHRDGRARPADVRGAFDQIDCAVRVDVQRAAGLEAHVEPESDRHAPALVRAFQRGLVVRVVPNRFKHLLATDSTEFRAIDATRAFLGRVPQPEFDRIHADLARDLVNHLLRSERSLRCAGRSVGGAARLVDDYVEAFDRDVLALVCGEDAHAARGDEGTRICARFVGQLGFHRLDRAVLGRADLDARVSAGRGAGSKEHVLAGHDDLDRAAALLRKERRDGFHVHGDLAAESAPDLGGRHADAGDRDLEDLGGDIAHHERTLGRTPQMQAAVVIPERRHVMGLDVALMHGRRVELALDDHVGLRETVADIA